MTEFKDLENVDWNTFADSKVITENESLLLQNVDHYLVEPLTLKKRIEEEGVKKYVDLFQSVLLKISNTSPVKRILFAFKTLLSLSDSFVEEFISLEKPFEGLGKHIDEDDFGVLGHLFLSFGILSRKVKESEKDILSIVLEKEIKKLNESIELNTNGISEILACTSGLMYLLQRENATCRSLFFGKEGVKKLIEILRIHINNIQICYETVFCLWLLSFSKDMEPYFVEVNISATLHSVLKKHQKEKVIRIVLHILKNLMKRQCFVNSIISIGLPKTLLNLSRNQFSDSDILELVNELHRKTESWIDELSSFDEYRQEVLSGQLEWSPVHKSTKFWQQNLDHFEENGYAIIKELLKLIKESKKSKTIEIAIHDIGGKTLIMSLMEHDDESVRNAALLCTQRIMLQKWAFLQK
eukprot:gene1263-11350_t